jgi:hypothetical protein
VLGNPSLRSPAPIGHAKDSRRVMVMMRPEAGRSGDHYGVPGTFVPGTYVPGTFRSDSLPDQRTIAATRLNAESTRCIIFGTAVIANRTTCRPGE